MKKNNKCLRRWVHITTQSYYSKIKRKYTKRKSNKVKENHLPEQRKRKTKERHKREQLKWLSITS